MVSDTATVLGWYVARVECGGLVLTRQRLIYAVLTAPGEPPSTLQAEWLDSHRADGHEVYTWNPSDLQAITKALSRRGRKA